MICPIEQFSSKTKLVWMKAGTSGRKKDLRIGKGNYPNFTLSRCNYCRTDWIDLGITMIQMMSFIVIMVSTEKSLKKTFAESGNNA